MQGRQESDAIIAIVDDDPSSRFWTDHVQPQQVFMNLMLNGIEAAKETAANLLCPPNVRRAHEVNGHSAAAQNISFSASCTEREPPIW